MNSLYVIGATWDGPVKIGVASDVPARIAVFRYKLPFEPMLLFSRPHDDAFALEAHVHRELAEHRLNGEWFDGSAFGVEGVAAAIRTFTGRTKTRGEPDEYSLQVAVWVRALVANAQKNSNSTAEAALAALEQETGLRRTFIWSQLYRPAVRVFAADYFATKAAYEALLGASKVSEAGPITERTN